MQKILLTNYNLNIVKKKKYKDKDSIHYYLVYRIGKLELSKYRLK